MPAIVLTENMKVCRGPYVRLVLVGRKSKAQAHRDCIAVPAIVLTENRKVCRGPYVRLVLDGRKSKAQAHRDSASLC